MTEPTGTAPNPPGDRLGGLVLTVQRLVQHAELYVRRQLVWSRLFRTASYLRSALWTVPLLAIVLVLISAPLIRWLDARLGWRLYRLTMTGAQSLYQSVITLTLSFLVFTFGSLLVAIQIAGGQLTPRIIATTLLRDRVVKYSVGLFVFTMVFAIMALNRLGTTVLDMVSLLTALLGIACIATFLFLIDYAARLLRPVSILARVGGEGLAVIKAVYPGRADDGLTTGPMMIVSPDLERRVVAHEGTSEIVLAIDLGTLVRKARRLNGVIEFLPHVGDFVATGEPLFVLYGAARAADDAKLRATVAFGPERTMEQDPLFSFRIMVDIGLKALSPAINDPTTAVLAIDQIHRLLREVGRRRLHGESIMDDDGRLRVVFRTPNWEDFVDLACQEIRSCGAANVQVARRLRAMLDNLVASLPSHRHDALLQEADRLTRTIAPLYRLPEDLALAQVADSQGLGGVTRDRSVPAASSR